ncbi:VanZ like family protein [Prevotella sp. tf2-5]|nr:VanZ like family protein [Prevotella sp. tf2-5]
MEESIKTYLQSLQREIPSCVFEGLLSMLVLGGVIALIIKGFKRGYRYLLEILLVEYVFLIYCSTVFFRTTNEFHKYNFSPFWSYAVSSDGCIFTPDKFMNILIFIPVGLLIGITFRSVNWWKAMIAGIVISSGIELLQLLLRRGMSELDDVFHNTIGCLIGCGLASVILRFVNIKNKCYGSER